jgi:hypothetical protein
MEIRRKVQREPDVKDHQYLLIFWAKDSSMFVVIIDLTHEVPSI